MGYETKVQLIERASSKQFYVSIPAASAEALEMKKGEPVEWVVQDKAMLLLKRARGRR